MSTLPSFNDPRVPSDRAPTGRPTDWRQPGLSVGIAFVLHVAALLFFLWRPAVHFTLAAAGRPVSSDGLRVTLVAAPNRPIRPTPAVTTPSQPVIRHVVQRHPPLLTSATPTARTVNEDETPTPPAPIVPPAQAAATTAPAPVNPAMNLPGAQAVRDVAHVTCRFDQPAYPPIARRLAHEGTVTLRVTIDRTGRVARADIATSSGHEELDAAAQGALLAGHCDPYVENGVPVEVHATQPVSFGLNN
ncbi:energy transducer TonB [Paraburkholderia caffeinilytica]|uniref:energy transducer TonB n=1 Tax=Paraburkholderia caffeinilytica TaxID=1761016 RepID=UPI0038B8B755